MFNFRRLLTEVHGGLDRVRPQQGHFLDLHGTELIVRLSSLNSTGSTNVRALHKIPARHDQNTRDIQPMLVSMFFTGHYHWILQAHSNLKHGALTQCCTGVGPLSTTLAHHQPTIWQRPRVCWGGNRNKHRLLAGNNQK